MMYTNSILVIICHIYRVVRFLSPNYVNERTITFNPFYYFPIIFYSFSKGIINNNLYIIG